MTNKFKILSAEYSFLLTIWQLCVNLNSNRDFLIFHPVDPFLKTVYLSWLLLTAVEPLRVLFPV